MVVSLILCYVMPRKQRTNGRRHRTRDEPIDSYGIFLGLYHITICPCDRLHSYLVFWSATIGSTYYGLCWEHCACCSGQVGQAHFAQSREFVMLSNFCYNQLIGAISLHHPTSLHFFPLVVTPFPAECKLVALRFQKLWVAMAHGCSFRFQSQCETYCFSTQMKCSLRDQYSARFGRYTPSVTFCIVSKHSVIKSVTLWLFWHLHSQQPWACIPPYPYFLPWPPSQYPQAWLSPPQREGECS